jgi:hypothetical protein
MIMGRVKTIVSQLMRAFRSRNRLGSSWPIAWADCPLRDVARGSNDGSSVAAEIGKAPRGAW